MNTQKIVNQASESDRIQFTLWRCLDHVRLEHLSIDAVDERMTSQYVFRIVSMKASIHDENSNACGVFGSRLKEMHLLSCYFQSLLGSPLTTA